MIKKNTLFFQLTKYVCWESDCKIVFIFFISLFSLLPIFFKRFYLVLERGEGKEKGRNINMQEKHQMVASRVPPAGEPGPQPRLVPWPGIEIEPMTFQFTGECSIHWATPARAICPYFKLDTAALSYSKSAKLVRYVFFSWAGCWLIYSFDIQRRGPYWQDILG